MLRVFISSYIVSTLAVFVWSFQIALVKNSPLHLYAENTTKTWKKSIHFLVESKKLQLISLSRCCRFFPIQFLRLQICRLFPMKRCRIKTIHSCLSMNILFDQFFVLGIIIFSEELRFIYAFIQFGGFSSLSLRLVNSAILKPFL